MGIKEIKRGKGSVYRVRVLRDGQKYDETFNRKYDAIQFHDRIVKFGGTPVETEMTFEVAAAEWIKNHAEVHKAPSSIAGDKRMLAKHILPVLGTLKLRKVSPRHIEELICLLKGKDLSKNTVSRYMDVLRTILNYYHRRQAIASNPMSVIGRLELDEQVIRFWTRQEVSQFLDYTKKKYQGTDRYGVHLLYKVVLYTGMRFGEAQALAWSAVDFENRLITVRRSYCNVSKVIRETTKNGKIRHVPLDEAIHDDLLEAHANRRNDLVLTLNDRMIDKSNLRNRYFYRDMKEAGVSRIRFHDLRHTYASHFMMSGGNVYTLQAILGHSDIKMTSRYAHLAKTHFAEKADIVRYDDGKVIGVDFQRKTGTEK